MQKTKTINGPKFIYSCNGKTEYLQDKQIKFIPYTKGQFSDSQLSVAAAFFASMGKAPIVPSYDSVTLKLNGKTYTGKEIILDQKNEKVYVDGQFVAVVDTNYRDEEALKIIYGAGNF